MYEPVTGDARKHQPLVPPARRMCKRRTLVTFPGETGGRVSIESSLTGPAFWLGIARRF